MTMWQRSDGWIGSHIDDSFVMINLESGIYVALNVTAANAWEMLAQPQSEDTLVAGLLERFDVEPDHCRREVRTLLDRMVAKDIVHSLA